MAAPGAQGARQLPDLRGRPRRSDGGSRRRCDDADRIGRFHGADHRAPQPPVLGHRRHPRGGRCHQGCARTHAGGGDPHPRGTLRRHLGGEPRGDRRGARRVRGPGGARPGTLRGRGGERSRAPRRRVGHRRVPDARPGHRTAGGGGGEALARPDDGGDGGRPARRDRPRAVAALRRLLLGLRRVGPAPRPRHRRRRDDAEAAGADRKPRCGEGPPGAGGGAVPRPQPLRRPARAVLPRSARLGAQGRPLGRVGDGAAPARA